MLSVADPHVPQAPAPSPTPSPVPQAQPAYRHIEVGEAAPWFEQRCTSNPRFLFETVGGRYVVLCLFGSAASPQGAAALRWVQQQRARFDDQHLSLFGVSVDVQDEQTGRVAPALPGIRHFWDFDARISRLYGALPTPAQPGDALWLGRWVVLDPAMNVLANIPMQPDLGDQQKLHTLLDSLPPVAQHSGMDGMHAPVTLVPRLLDAQLCRALVAEYDRLGGQPSGYMREVNGRTVVQQDPQHKRRSDCHVADPALLDELRRQLTLKLKPLLWRVHCFHLTRVERYMVGCYEARDGGHFQPHRDNTTPGTAHRRFALSVNLNDDFDGGELCFPEYGTRSYRLPPGHGAVFSGALLHTVQPMRRGRRLALLPFLYDEQAARERAANNALLGDGLQAFSLESDDLLQPPRR